VGDARRPAHTGQSGGCLVDPALPDIQGLQSFGGELFHTARWNHDYDLTGKRVGVIGTGASAVQVVPSIAPQARRLAVFQRTPAWVVPKRGNSVVLLGSGRAVLACGSRAALQSREYRSGSRRGSNSNPFRRGSPRDRDDGVAGSPGRGGQSRVHRGCVCAPFAAHCRRLITPRNAADATPRHSSVSGSTCRIGDLGPVEVA